MRRRHRVLSTSRHRYGRMVAPGSYEWGSYRQYGLRIVTRDGSVRVDILKRGFVEASAHGDSRAEAMAKARRIVDAMHGD